MAQASAPTSTATEFLMRIDVPFPACEGGAGRGGRPEGRAEEGERADPDSAHTAHAFFAAQTARSGLSMGKINTKRQWIGFAESPICGVRLWSSSRP
ncbi:hypothetical protein GCM10010428_26190 [Actinosynnema pretiosum subsp. pretiosum]